MKPPRPEVAFHLGPELVRRERKGFWRDRLRPVRVAEATVATVQSEVDGDVPTA